MNTELRPPSAVREESPFPTPPRVRVVADEERAPEAVALAEALDEHGAEADVRLEADATAIGYDHVRPDAIVIDVGAQASGMVEQCRGAGQPPVLIAVTESDDRGERRRARAAGFDLIVTRPVDPSALMERLGDYLFGAHLNGDQDELVGRIGRSAPGLQHFPGSRSRSVFAARVAAEEPLHG